MNEFRKLDADLKKKISIKVIEHTHSLLFPKKSEVWITSGDKPIAGKVSETFGTPRSYNIDVKDGQVRRNHCHLNVAHQRMRKKEHLKKTWRETHPLTNQSKEAQY